MVSITTYDFENEHIEAFSDLLTRLYSSHNHSETHIELKKHLLNPDNPFFSRGEIKNIIAYEGNEPVGHISAITDPRLNGIGLIGFYESTDDEIANVLIDEAIVHLDSQGCRTIRGPIDQTIWHQYRFALNQHPNSVFTAEIMNLPSYPKHFEAIGFGVAKKFASLLRRDLDTMLEYADRIVPHLEERGFHIQEINQENFSLAQESILEMSNRIFADSWSFVPLTMDSFRYLYGQNPKVADKTKIEILKDKDENAIGFSYAIPDLTNGTLVLKSIGILPEKKHTWGGIMMGASQIENARSLGFDSIIFALRRSEKVPKDALYKNSSVVREYASYEMSL